MQLTTYSSLHIFFQSGVLFMLLGCIMPCIPALLLRQEARERSKKNLKLFQRKIYVFTFISFQTWKGTTLRATPWRMLGSPSVALPVSRFVLLSIFVEELAQPWIWSTLNDFLFSVRQRSRSRREETVPSKRTQSGRDETTLTRARFLSEVQHHAIPNFCFN